MVEYLAKALHVSVTLLYTSVFVILMLSSLVLGVALNRFLHYWEKKLTLGWSKICVAFLKPLPVPLFLLWALYAGLESLPLPLRYERIVSKVILVAVRKTRVTSQKFLELTSSKWRRNASTSNRDTTTARPTLTPSRRLQYSLAWAPEYFSCWLPES